MRYKRHQLTGRSFGFWSGDWPGPYVYLAGARAGGVAQFDIARDDLVADYCVISPADLDRKNAPTSDDTRRIIAAEALSSIAADRGDAFVMLLSGWEECPLAAWDVAQAVQYGLRTVDSAMCDVSVPVTVFVGDAALEHGDAAA